MPQFGLGRAVREAARRARVRRPGEEALEETAERARPEGMPPGLASDLDEPVRPPETPRTPEEKPAVTPDVEIEAQRLSDARLGDYSLDETFQTNFDTINTTDDIKAVIADVSQQNAGRIEEARRGVITEVQLRDLADDLGFKEDVVRAVMERESGGILNAETILAARQILNSSADRIHNFAVSITRGQATDLDKLRFRRQLQWHNEYQTQFMGARAEAGRALNAFRIPTDESFDISHMREMIENAAGHDTARVASAIAMMDSTPAITRASRQYTQSKLMGTINELFINSILSGPKTHIINTSGNVMMQAMSVAETAVAARLGRFLPGDEHVQVGEATALIHGTISAWRDAFRLSARSARTGVALDDVVKFEGTRRRSISAEHLMTAEQRATPLGSFAEGLIDGFTIGDVPVPGVGPVIRAPTERVMMPVDEFFKTLAYRGELERLTFVRAQQALDEGSITRSELNDFVIDLMESPPTDLQRAAEDYTRYVTFQNPLGTVGTKVQLALRSTPVLSLVAPFVRTPVNIFTAGILDRSPVALFRQKFRQAMKNGGRERDMMLARVSMGSATSAVVASYVMDGTITGNGPSNPDARRLLEMSGWQPYSIKVGDEYVSYARMEPIAFVMGATADAVETLSYINSDVDGLEDESQQMNDAAAAIIIGIANNTMSKTYLQGIADLTEMLNAPSRYAARYFQKMGTSIVPYSSFRRQMGQLQDPYLREANSIMESIRVNSGVPGLSENAPPRRDLFGQPRTVRAGDLIGPMSPIPSREEVVDPVLDELIVLMETTRSVPVTMPNHRVEGMRLDSEEYDTLVRISRTEPLPSTGRTFHEELNRMMGLSTYLDATSDMQVELIKRTQSIYDEAARVLLEERDPLFAARIAAHRQRRNELRFGVQ